MTDRFHFAFLLNKEWWKKNSPFWYAMNIVAALIGLYLYKMILLDRAESGTQAGLGGILLLIVLLCSVFAAIAHVKKKRGEDKPVEVNTALAAALWVGCLGLTAALALLGAPALLTVLGFMASAVTFALMAKNLFVGYFTNGHF